MNLRISGSPRVASTLTLLAALTGCVIVDKNDDTGTGTAGMSSTSGDGTTSPTTSGSSGDTGVLTGGATITTEVPTSTDASATGESTTADSTGGDSTGGDSTGGDSTGGDSTGGASPALQASCEAACAVFLECQPGAYPDLETCAAECIEGAAGGPKCEAAATEFNNCIGGFTCAELNKAINDDFGACTDAFNAYNKSCFL